MDKHDACTRLGLTSDDLDQIASNIISAYLTRQREALAEATSVAATSTAPGERAVAVGIAKVFERQIAAAQDLRDRIESALHDGDTVTVQQEDGPDGPWTARCSCGWNEQQPSAAIAQAQAHKHEDFTDHDASAA